MRKFLKYLPAISIFLICFSCGSDERIENTTEEEEEEGDVVIVDNGPMPDYPLSDQKNEGNWVLNIGLNFL